MTNWKISVYMMQTGSTLMRKALSKKKTRAPTEKYLKMHTEHIPAIFQMANSNMKRCSIPSGGKEIKLQVERLVLPVRFPETTEDSSQPQRVDGTQPGLSGGYFGQNTTQSLAQQCLF